MRPSVHSSSARVGATALSATSPHDTECQASAMAMIAAAVVEAIVPYFVSLMAAPPVTFAYTDMTTGAGSGYGRHPLLYLMFHRHRQNRESGSCDLSCLLCAL
jgi:hypothetical protein